MMSVSSRLLLLLLVSALARAGHHLIRLALLVALGLAGMYMLHTLAQDYNTITNRPNRPAVAATRALFRAITKRDVAQVQVADGDGDASPRSQMGYAGQLLRQVVMRDPLGCARKLVCQLAASNHLRPHEAAILRLVQWRDEGGVEDEDAEFQVAQKIGKSSKDGAQCSLRYNKCLLEPRAFLKLLAAVS